MSLAKRNGKRTGDLVGQQLGDYVLSSRLATGGMAYIYKGVDSKLQRQAAIKVLTPELMEADATLTERFQREARAIAALEHENIITLYQYGEQDGLYFLAMKYVQGIDLADELNRLRTQGETMDIKRALRILEQVAAALDYAHAAGIVHRDVKPSNILLDQNDKAIITDFGLVLRRSVDQTMGTAFGTPRYISPEQALASENAVPQSDIYSLAVILFEILTGQSVFRGATPMEMALSHINEPPPPPRSINPEIPDAVEAEILRALSKDPLQRHRTALEFIHAVKTAYGLPLEITETPGSPPSTVSVTTPKVVATPTPILIDFSRPKPVSKRARQIAKSWEQRWPLVMASLAVVAAISIYGVLLIIADRNSTAGELPTMEPSAIVAAVTGEATPDETLEPTLTDTAAPATARTVVAANSTPEPGPTNTPLPTFTGTPAVSIVGTNPGSGQAISVVYNYEALAIRNQNSFQLDLRDLKFVRGDDDGSDDFYGSTVTGGVLPSGQCILILLEGRRIDVPADWGCDAQHLHYQVIRSGASLFWRIDGLVDTFEVRLNDTPVQTCPAVARGQSGQCQVDWISIAEGAAG